MSVNAKYVKSVFFILLASSLWGCTGLITKPLINEYAFSAFDVAGARMFTAGIVVLIVVLIFKREALIVKKKDIWILALIGISRFLTMSLLFQTQKYTDLEVAVAFEMTSPLFVIILSVPIFKQSVTFKKLAAIIMLIVGCCTLSGLFMGTEMSIEGIICGILTAISVSVFVISSKVAGERGYSPLTLLVYMFILGSILSIPFVDIPGIVHACMVNVEILELILIIGLFLTAFAYFVFFKGIKNVSATVASILEVSEIVVSTIIGMTVFGEDVTVPKIVGIGIIVFAVIFLNLELKKLDFAIYSPKKLQEKEAEK